MAQQLDSRYVLRPAPLGLGVPTKPRLESRIKEFKLHFISFCLSNDINFIYDYDCPFRPAKATDVCHLKQKQKSRITALPRCLKPRHACIAALLVLSHTWCYERAPRGWFAVDYLPSHDTRAHTSRGKTSQPNPLRARQNLDCGAIQMLNFLNATPCMHPCWRAQANVEKLLGKYKGKERKLFKKLKKK